MSRSKQEESNIGNSAEITLGLLRAIDADESITQRDLARDLGVALGLANAYMKRCIRTGLIKVRQAPANRYKYYMTPKGMNEKSRLTAEFLKQSFNFYRASRHQLGGLLDQCEKARLKRIALAGKSDLAEVAILSAAERNLTLAGIIDHEAVMDSFMGIPVSASATALGGLDAVIITNMNEPQAVYDEVIKYFPADRIFCPSFLEVSQSKKATKRAGE